MVYIRTKDNQSIIVLGPEHIEKIENGKFCETPDQLIVFAYCPDIDWFSAKLNGLIDDKNEMDMGQFQDLVEEGIGRPVIHAKHEPRRVI